MASMQITIEQEQSQATVVRLSGEIDSGSMGEVGRAIDGLPKAEHPYVVAEMSGVTLFSSAALGIFMGCRKRLVEKEGDLVLCGLSFDLRTKLNLLGATKVFRVFPDIRAAVNAFRWEYERIGQNLQLEIPSELRYVPPVRQLVSRIARQKGYSGRDAFRIETIVDEVCNNAIEHGARGEDKHIDLNLTIDPAKIEIEVINATDPAKVGSLQDLATSIQKGTGSDPEVRRGRGLALIKMLSSDLKIDMSENGTSVHVTRIRGD